MLSNEVLSFLNNNGISYEEVSSKVDVNLYSLEDIDFTINSYLIWSDKERKSVSVADIVGYDYKWCDPIRTNNIFESFSNFFQINGDSYHSRANGMLNYTSDTVIEGLLKSFKVEPIKLCGAPHSKYVIQGNGLHRYTVLRSLYLMELAKLGDSPNTLSSLKEKYSIPVVAAEIDYIKTYANYILTTLGIVKYVSKEYDANYNETGNAVITFKDKTEKVFSNSALLELVTESLMQNQDLWVMFNNYLNRSEEFRIFLSTICPDMLKQNDKSNNMEVSWKI